MGRAGLAEIEFTLELAQDFIVDHAVVTELNRCATLHAQQFAGYAREALVMQEVCGVFSLLFSG